ncbi:MAG: hypothetical protein ACFCUE_06255 [Candidatus Bathyarchaeia archaeon]|jgi:hypothetical protein
MKKLVYAATIVLTLLVLNLVAMQNFDFAYANPISVYQVPGIQVSYPLKSIGGYVNSTVEFNIYVYMPIDSPKLDSVAYSVDGQPQAIVDDLDFAVSSGPINGSLEEKDFKKYTAHITLEYLSEGSHTLEAQSGNMIDTQSFTVNSHYVIANLKTLSPTCQIYFDPTVPLTFNVNGEIQDAHYYLYQNSVLISEKALKGNTTLNQLADGNYDLLLFATTEHGQTSEKIQFLILKNIYLYVIIIAAFLTIGIALGVTFIVKKRKTASLDNLES